MLCLHKRLPWRKCSYHMSHATTPGIVDALAQWPPLNDYMIVFHSTHPLPNPSLGGREYTSHCDDECRSSCLNFGPECECTKRHHLIILPSFTPSLYIDYPLPPLSLELQTSFVTVQAHLGTSRGERLFTHTNVEVACGAQCIVFKHPIIQWAKKSTCLSSDIHLTLGAPSHQMHIRLNKANRLCDDDTYTNEMRWLCYTINEYDVFIFPKVLWICPLPEWASNEECKSATRWLSRQKATVKIQRAWRHHRQEKSARAIQAAWRRCYMCPDYKVCQKWIQNYIII